MKKSILSDMDGVIYRGGELIPGAKVFISQLLSGGYPFLFLTNNSEQTPLDLLRKLEGLGVEGLSEEHFLTSAMATAIFLKNQGSGKSAYVIGGAGLSTELYNAGFSITEKNPDYVVVGKTKNYNYEMISTATELIQKGARFYRNKSGYGGSCGRRRAGTGLRQSAGPYRMRDREKTLCCRKAQCDDDADRPEEARIAFREYGHDRGPDGYGYHRGDGGRHDNLSCSFRGFRQKHYYRISLPSHPCV